MARKCSPVFFALAFSLLAWSATPPAQAGFGLMVVGPQFAFSLSGGMNVFWLPGYSSFAYYSDGYYFRWIAGRWIYAPVYDGPWVPVAPWFALPSLLVYGPPRRSWCIDPISSGGVHASLPGTGSITQTGGGLTIPTSVTMRSGAIALFPISGHIPWLGNARACTPISGRRTRITGAVFSRRIRASRENTCNTGPVTHVSGVAQVHGADIPADRP